MEWLTEQQKKKLLASFLLGLNVLVTFFRLLFFGGVKGYLIGVLLCFILLLLFWRTSYFKYVIQVLLGMHLLFHGLVMLSFPMGVVFALIGSYGLAVKVVGTIYLPTLLLVFLDSYFLFGKRFFLKKTKK